MNCSNQLADSELRPDFGESHYVGRIAGAQPNSNGWVDGFPHTEWLNMAPIYIFAFKTGRWPSVVRDEMWIWSRPHPAKADAQNDPLGKPTGYDWVILRSFCVTPSSL
jgi:glucan endo-1,3-alpha-glucosidase